MPPGALPLIGVATGGWGDTSSRIETLGGHPSRNRDFKEKILNISKNIHIFQYFRNKVGEILGEIGIWGYVVLTHLNPSPPQSESGPPPPPHGGNFVATPCLCFSDQTLCGASIACCYQIQPENTNNLPSGTVRKQQ